MVCWRGRARRPTRPPPAFWRREALPLATGNLGLTCVVIPDEMAEKLSLRRQVWSADYAGDPGGD